MANVGKYTRHLVCLPTWTVDVYGRCRQTYQSHVSSGSHHDCVFVAPEIFYVDLLPAKNTTARNEPQEINLVTFRYGDPSNGL